MKKKQEKPISKKLYRQESNENNEQNNIVMNTKDKIELAKEILDDKKEVSKFKKVKKDKGLIEKTESSITVLTEDNRELLKD